MNKIDEIRRLISENRHADALNICLKDFPEDEYTQEEREQVTLFRIECIFGIIPFSELGVLPGNGVHHEIIQGNIEYNPEYNSPLDALGKCIAGLGLFIRTQDTYDAKLAKYHEFQDFLNNLIIRRINTSINKYGEQATDSESWNNWLRFNYGVLFMDLLFNRYIFALGQIESLFEEDDTTEFTSSLNKIDFPKLQIQSLYNASVKINEKFEEISEGDYIIEDNADEAFSLLNTAINIERFLIGQFKTYTGIYSEKYSNEEFVTVKRKVLLSFIVTALNAEVVGKGKLVFDEDVRNDLYEEACELQKDITPYDPNFDGIGLINNSSPSVSVQNNSGGCYVATAVYGSYDCPEVWTLRRYRDYTLAETWYGRVFVKTYYAISPTLVKWLGHTEWFKKMWRGTLDGMVKTLQTKGFESTPYEDKEWK